MLLKPIDDSEFKMLSQSVQAWYRYYDIRPDPETSQVLCSAAITVFNAGHKSREEVTRLLIARFPADMFIEEFAAVPGVH